MYERDVPSTIPATVDLSVSKLEHDTFLEHIQ